MRTKFSESNHSAFSNCASVLSLFVCAAVVCSMVTGTLLAVFLPKALADVSQRTLTFAERVTYQRAIEEVYWRHRIWPKERPDPKPPLDAVMSQAQLEKKVTDYLRKLQALEDYFQYPITAEQLQAEMERMARDTKQPEVLRELFAALGNDPFIIAECLARPLLAERLVAELSVHDKSERLAPVATRAVGSKFNITILGKAIYSLPKVDPCTDDTWTPTSINNAPAPRVQHRAVWTGSEMIVWGGFNPTPLNTGGRYNPSTDSWTPTSTINAPSGREYHTLVWSGTEMIVWGGTNFVSYLNTGGRYNPGTDSWTPISTSGAPAGRYAHTAVWTGSEMIVWGGFGASGVLNTGGRLGSNGWTSTNMMNAPEARARHTAVLADSEMIVWGGFNGNIDVNTGGRYNPGTDSWVATSTVNAPSPRDNHTAVLAGNEMIVWGGFNGLFNTGGRYDPGSDSWTATSTINAPAGRARHTAVWSGSEMIVWGGYNNSSNILNNGGRYNPSTDSWTSTSTTNAPAVRESHTAVWSGSEMIVWGGTVGVGTFFNTGGKYCVGPPKPTPTPTASPTPSATVSPTSTPTPTTTPTPCDSGVIQNGRFETGDLVGWVIDGHNNDPVITNTLSHTGTYSALAGLNPQHQTFCEENNNEPSGDSSFYQQFTVPAGGGLLSFWYWTCTFDFITSDWQDAYITDTNGAILQTIFHQCSDNDDWVQQTVDMGPHAGQTVRIKFLVHQDGHNPLGDVTGMYVDDVQLSAPCPSPSPTPTTTATATVTPIATATATSTSTPIPTPTATGTATPTPTATVAPRPTATPRSRPTPAPRP